MADKRMPLPVNEDELKAVTEKIFGAMGFAAKAGKLVCGRELCIEQMKKGKAVMAFFPQDISDNAKRELSYAFDKSDIPYIAMPVLMSEMSDRLGKTSSVSCAVITDCGFADIIYKLLGKAVKNNNVSAE